MASAGYVCEMSRYAKLTPVVAAEGSTEMVKVVGWSSVMVPDEGETAVRPPPSVASRLASNGTCICTEGWPTGHADGHLQPLQSDDTGHMAPCAWKAEHIQCTKGF